ncbi:MAG: isoprenyl transferase [Alphaproteobacteria bacterium]|nr:isoprenyl transferase [Alphaproteobacteria bacterium]
MFEQDGKTLQKGVSHAPRGAGMPQHVGIIMDGNGRWAASRGLPRVEGHRRGVEALRRTLRIAGDYRIPFITIYAFSTENWRRPAQEITYLLGLLRRFIRNDLAELHRNGVRVRMIGARANVPPDVIALMDEAETLTRDNKNMTLVVAFNYGARQEIAGAARDLAERVALGELDPAAIDTELFALALDTAGMPDPDLIIRTSGEQRLSNFLLWQAAYAEFVFLPIHWPDFDKPAFDDALAEFHRRDRRYGALAQEENAAPARTALGGT